MLVCDNLCWCSLRTKRLNVRLILKNYGKLLSLYNEKILDSYFIWQIFLKPSIVILCLTSKIILTATKWSKCPLAYIHITWYWGYMLNAKNMWFLQGKKSPVTVTESRAILYIFTMTYFLSLLFWSKKVLLSWCH